MSATWMKATISRIRQGFAALFSLGHARGWPFVLSWGHRTSGIILVLFLVAHILTLRSLDSPQEFDAKLNLFGSFPLVFLEWALAAPVIFHSLNGARILVYEGVSTMWDHSIRRWVLLGGAAYTIFLGWFMAMGTQSVSYELFWTLALFGSMVSFVTMARRFWKRYAPLGWRLQRFSGALLLVLVPAHMLFMHLNYSMGHEAAVVLERLKSALAKGIDGVLLVSATYHGAYGIFSVASDYVGSKALRVLTGLVIGAVSTLLGWLGFRVLMIQGG